MIIDGIEFFIGIFCTDDENELEFIDECPDFVQLNEFITKHPEYADKQMAYTFMEVIDGKTDSYSWCRHLEWKIYDDTECQKMIDDYLQDEKEWHEYCAKMDERQKAFRYIPSNADYTKKQQRLKDLAYACPRCFRTVDDCRCRCYPFYLVQIDKLMLPIIRELNEKGYETAGCCAGHIEEEEFKTTGIYIAFKEEYDFDEAFPAGGRYSKLKHIISYVPAEDCNDLERFQRYVLDDLLEWAELLMENGWSFIDDEE